MGVGILHCLIAAQCNAIMYAMFEESSTTMNSGADWNEKPGSTRPANLAQGGKPEHFPISASHYSNSKHVKTLTGEESDQQESAFSTPGNKATGTSIKRTKEGRGVANYGAITGTPRGPDASDGGKEDGGQSPSNERKQSAAAEGQAYDKIASRNKRAQHATTYAKHSIIAK